MPKLLKCELHTHAREDRVHRNLPYAVKDLIDVAHTQQYDVLATTFHDKVFSGKPFAKAKAYAKKKGILLISGCELTIEGRHTLVYGITEKERSKINTFHDLRKLKIRRQKAGNPLFIIAPHPYFAVPVMSKYCLRGKLIKNIDLFDAIEYSFFYFKGFNKNKKAVAVAKKYCKPMVGNADIHAIENLNMTYTLISAQKNEKSIFQAIHDGKTKVVSKPLTYRHVLKLAFYHSLKS